MRQEMATVCLLFPCVAMLNLVKDGRNYLGREMEEIWVEYGEIGKRSRHS